MAVLETAIEYKGSLIVNRYEWPHFLQEQHRVGNETGSLFGTEAPGDHVEQIEASPIGRYELRLQLEDVRVVAGGHHSE